jgi:hypothetical protein
MKSNTSPKVEQQNPPKTNPRKTITALLIIGILYFVVMIFPNITGAKDANMLGVFNNDEFAQYPFALHMITPGSTFFQSIHNFAVYSYYYYGYPSFFFSALFLIPVKLILGANWTQHTPVIVAYLRQMINVLPILLSIGFMVFIQTRFRSFWRSLILAALILIVPAVTYNSLWWHPDSLFTLFVVLTLFFFWRDDQRLGINFILAAISCGLAIGTKEPGVLFILTVPVYILWSGIKSHYQILEIAWKIILFLLVMIGTVILSNPLLLLPIERGEIIAREIQGGAQNILGFYTTSTDLIKWAGTASVVTTFNGSWFFLILLLILQVIGALNPKKRLVYVLILTWFIPYVLFLTFIETTMKEYYFLPVIIPLVSGVEVLLEKVPTLWKKKWGIRPWRIFAEKILLCLASALVIVQGVIFMTKDVTLYQSTLSREQNSASLRFFNNFQQAVLTKLPNDIPLKFYHDWKAYLPDGQPHWQVFSTFDLASYDYIQTIQPDFILLERENILYFSNSALLTNSVNLEKAIRRMKFYSDALNGNLQGYALVYQDVFGSAFIKQELKGKYLSSIELEIPHMIASEEERIESS